MNHTPKRRITCPITGLYSIGPENYLDHLRKVKQAVKIPVIGSLNGVSTGGWVDYAKKIEQTGADALELNLYDLATDPNLTSAQLEDSYITLVGDIRKQLRIPLAVKLSPFFTSLPNFARHLVEAGANGLVLFNRFYQPDFDLDELHVVPEPGSEQLTRAAPTAALDRHSARARSSRFRPDQRRAHGRRCDQGTHGWSQCCHGRFRVPASRYLPRS